MFAFAKCKKSKKEGRKGGALHSVKHTFHPLNCFIVDIMCGIYTTCITKYILERFSKNREEEEEEEEENEQH